MRLLSLAVAALSAFAIIVWAKTDLMQPLLLGLFGFANAAVTFRSQQVGTFLRILMAIFATEVVAFGGVFLFSLSDFWPTALDPYKLPDSVPLTVALFGVLVWSISHFKVVRTISGIADRFFNAPDITVANLWPFGGFRMAERRLATAMVVFLVVLNQAQVGINVRLSYFSRDWFNAIQERDAATFWTLLFTVFLFWAAIFIASAIIEFVVQSMLLIRWRRWLTEHYTGRWLDGSAHYRMSLKSGNADNPDQRIAEDVNRFVTGGSGGSSGGYGIYSYSILLIATLSSLVSFSIILWILSANFTIPGTQIAVPGFLLWVSIVYSLVGTLVTHVIGRSLVRLYFERQRYEADFRFSLARLREYSEQVALLKGEPAERSVAMRIFGFVYDNYLRIVDRRKKLLVFTEAYGQIGPFIPYIVAAPFYFAGKIQLGVMTQTASAWGRVDAALNFFVNYYTSLADFKAVLDRLSTFDDSIAEAHALEHTKKIGAIPNAATSDIRVANLDVGLPDGRTIITAASFDLQPGEAVLVSGPSGSGKSTLFRALSGIWPFGRGEITVPAGAKDVASPEALPAHRHFAHRGLLSVPA
jgi:putative ATP-binding cassette transporter